MLSARATYPQFWNAQFGRAPLVPLNDAEKIISSSTQPEVMEHTVLPLWRKIESLWLADGGDLDRFGGPELPMWFSSFRLSELERQVKVELQNIVFLSCMITLLCMMLVVAGMRAP